MVIMKYTLLSLVLISTQLTGMETTNVSSKKNDDLYAIMEKVEQNKPKPCKGLSFLRECLSSHYKGEIGLNDMLMQIHNKDVKDNAYFLLCKNYLPFYKKCIIHILPLDIRKQIDNLYAQLKNTHLVQLSQKKNNIEFI